MFTVGDALETRYENNPNVTVDNSPSMRKYVFIGKSVVGFTHGSEESMNNLPLLMMREIGEEVS